MHAAFDEAAMADDYQMLEELGSGSFGVVYKAIEKSTGDLVAIKHIDLEGNDDDIREIQQEISLLSTCSSDYVTRYKASFVKGVKLWIVMEFLGGGSCLDLVCYIKVSSCISLTFNSSNQAHSPKHRLPSSCENSYKVLTTSTALERFTETLKQPIYSYQATVMSSLPTLVSQPN